jgi:opacity protein-like surface antigen
MKFKIKLQLAIVIIAVLMGATTFAQGLYINAGAGYGFPAAPYLLGENSDIQQNGEISSTHHFEIVKGSGSLGKGLQAGAIIGYMFNPNVGAELGISYLFGGKIESKSEYQNDDYSNMYESTLSAKMLRFTPALKMTAGKGNVKPYLKTGLVVGVAGKIKSESKSTSTGEYNEGTTESEAEGTGGISIGFAGALGADFMFTDNIGIFAEMGIITQSWAPKKGEITKYTVDGEDHLDDMTTHDKEVEFVDSYSYTSGDYDENSPDQELKTYFPFSSVGVNVGIKITLGGAKE